VWYARSPGPPAAKWLDGAPFASKQPTSLTGVRKAITYSPARDSSVKCPLSSLSASPPHIPALSLSLSFFLSLSPTSSGRFYCQALSPLNPALEPPRRGGARKAKWSTHDDTTHATARHSRADSRTRKINLAAIDRLPVRKEAWHDGGLTATHDTILEAEYQQSKPDGRPNVQAPCRLRYWFVPFLPNTLCRMAAFSELGRLSDKPRRDKQHHSAERMSKSFPRGWKHTPFTSTLQIPLPPRPPRV
jgi:hypothetical protein